MAKINWLHPDTIDIIVHAGLGMYSRAIGARFGLTETQVQYRIQKDGASKARRDFRNGQGPVFGACVTVLEPKFHEMHRVRLASICAINGTRSSVVKHKKK